MTDNNLIEVHLKPGTIYHKRHYTNKRKFYLSGIAGTDHSGDEMINVMCEDNMGRSSICIPRSSVNFDEKRHIKKEIGFVYEAIAGGYVRFRESHTHTGMHETIEIVTNLYDATFFTSQSQSMSFLRKFKTLIKGINAKQISVHRTIDFKIF